MPNWYLKGTGNRRQPVTICDRFRGSAFEVTNCDLKRGPSLPPLYAFTEQGVAMLSSVLRSQRAVEVNIAIMRTFVQLRRLMDSNRDLAQKIGEMEEKYDGQFCVVFDAIRQLISPPAEPSRELGFHTIPPAKPAKKATRSREIPWALVTGRLWHSQKISDQPEAGLLAFFRVKLAGEEVSSLDGTSEGLAAVGGGREDGRGI